MGEGTVCWGRGGGAIWHQIKLREAGAVAEWSRGRRTLPDRTQMVSQGKGELVRGILFKMLYCFV